MELTNFFSVFLIFSLLSCFRCSEELEHLYERMDAMERGMDILSNNFDDLEIEISNKQEREMLSLRSEVNNHIKQHVKKTLTDIMRGESFEGIVRSQVISEMKHLKRANHQMRRHLNQMEAKLGQVQEDNRMYREALQKTEKEKYDLICSKCLVNSEHVKSKLVGYDQAISELNEKLREKNESCEEEKKSGTDLSSETTSQTTSTVSTSITTQSTTTPKPQREISRILVAQLWSSTPHQFRQLSLQTNDVTTYSFLNLVMVDSVVYVSKMNSLLIGLNYPYKIISSKLNSSRVQTVRYNVRTVGMAVDEDREVIFLTTYHPSRTICRMTFRGKNFTAIVSLPGNGEIPRAITLHTKTKTIYACNFYKLIMVRYDGSGLTTLDTGGNINAVTLDITNGLLYYINAKKLMKMSLSTNTRSEVTDLGFAVWNLIYYRDTVYYMSYSQPYGTLGAVDVGSDIRSHTLLTMNIGGHGFFAICLIP